MRTAARGWAVRTAKIVGVLCLLAAIAIGAAVGGRHLKSWLFTSPTFALERFLFEGLAHAEEGELVRLSGLELGDNIFRSDVLAAERAMATHPWVERVTIDRAYPRRLRVRVVEHQPAALTDLGGLYYVSPAGKAFKRLVPGDAADLPILRGVDREAYSADPSEGEALFREGLEAFAIYREAGLEERWPVSEIQIDPLEGLTFFCGQQAVAVKLGRTDLQAKFERLDKLFDELSRRGARAEVIRLDNRTRPGWVAVQLAQGGTGGEAAQ